jgi:hypothetical protein
MPIAVSWRNVRRNTGLTSLYLVKLRFESLPFMTTTGICLFAQVAIRFGHTSSSTRATIVGFIRCKKRRTEKLKSKGKRVTVQESEYKSVALAIPVSVVTQITTSYPIAFKSETSVRIALTSPTETA